MRLPDHEIGRRLLARSVGSASGCWLFTGYADAQGYSRLFDGNEKRLVHRLAYEVFVGPIPDGLQIDHVRERGCVHRNCVNPAHLEAVTPWENTMRSDSPSAVNAAKTQCDHGHAFTPTNTRMVKRPDGLRRACRACDRERARAYRERKAA